MKNTTQKNQPSTGKERVVITPEQLDTMMPPGEEVHTFMQAGNMIVGANWSRQEILDAARKGGAELSGEQATKMGHGVFIWDEKRRAVFVKTVSPVPPVHPVQQA